MLETHLRHQFISSSSRRPVKNYDVTAGFLSIIRPPVRFLPLTASREGTFVPSKDETQKPLSVAQQEAACMSPPDIC